jgi:uncharacterized protein YecT (DUF1311 family)
MEFVMKQFGSVSLAPKWAIDFGHELAENMVRLNLTSKSVEQNNKTLKLKLNGLRDKMYDFKTKIRDKNQCKTEYSIQIDSLNKAYKTLLSEVTKAKNDNFLKESQLKIEKKNINDIQQNLSKEKNLVSILNQYISEYNESQQVAPDISLLGIEDNNILNQIIDNINQEI